MVRFAPGMITSIGIWSPILHPTDNNMENVAAALHRSEDPTVAALSSVSVHCLDHPSWDLEPQPFQSSNDRWRYAKPGRSSGGMRRAKCKLFLFCSTKVPRLCKYGRFRASCGEYIPS